MKRFLPLLLFFFTSLALLTMDLINLRKIHALTKPAAQVRPLQNLPFLFIDGSHTTINKAVADSEGIVCYQDITGVHVTKGHTRTDCAAAIINTFPRPGQPNYKTDCIAPNWPHQTLPDCPDVTPPYRN